MERCSSSTIATASRWNSGGYFDGRPLGRFLLDMDSSYTRCPPNGGMVIVDADLDTLADRTVRADR